MRPLPAAGANYGSGAQNEVRIDNLLGKEEGCVGRMEGICCQHKHFDDKFAAEREWEEDQFQVRQSATTHNVTQNWNDKSTQESRILDVP